MSGGKGAVYNSSCFSNLFLPDTNTTTTAVDKPGLVCPTLHIHRPSNQSNLTTAFFYHYVETDPLLYSFANCSCAAPLEPHYHRDTAGLASYNLCLPFAETSGKCVQALRCLVVAHASTCALCNLTCFSCAACMLQLVWRRAVKLKKPGVCRHLYDLQRWQQSVALCWGSACFKFTPGKRRCSARV